MEFVICYLEFAKKLADSRFIVADMGAESGSDNILNLMNRKYTKADYLRKIEYLKKKVPEVSITTDIIVGFHGESDRRVSAQRGLSARVRDERDARHRALSLPWGEGARRTDGAGHDLPGRGGLLLSFSTVKYPG